MRLEFRVWLRLRFVLGLAKKKVLFINPNDTVLAMVPRIFVYVVRHITEPLGHLVRLLGFLRNLGDTYLSG